MLLQMVRVARVTDIHHVDLLDHDYWASCGPAQRIEAVTVLRSEIFGFDDATESRLQRVCQIL